MSTEIPENKALVEVPSESTVGDFPTDAALVIQDIPVETSSTEEREESVEESVRNQKVAEFFSDPITHTVAFLQPYKSIFVTIGLVLLVILGIKLVWTMLSAILSVATSIPLLSPLFELIGVIYAGWFIYRYLLSAQKRQELSQQFSEFKQEFLGESSQQ